VDKIEEENTDRCVCANMAFKAYQVTEFCGDVEVEFVPTGPF